MRYLIKLSYDGSKFYGFQRQKDKETVQGNIEVALSKILNEETKVTGASRTDRGVHAYSQFISFDTDKNIDKNKLLYSLNKLTSEYIYHKNIREVDSNFSPRHSVKMKEYVYKINIGEYNPIEKDYVYQYNKEIDINLMNKIVNKIKGVHDFRSFTSDKEKDNYIREVKDIKLVVNENYVYVYIKATSFLRYMIRNIIGLMLDINDGIKTIDDINIIFENKNRSSCGRCADACGLYLSSITYE